MRPAVALPEPRPAVARRPALSESQKLLRIYRRHISCAAGAARQAEPQDDLFAVSLEGVEVTLRGPALDKKVLHGATLRVPHGTLHFLLGPNGCGKSTLLRVAAGLLAPDAGRVEVAAPYGFVFQNPDSQVVMPTVGADVAFGLGRYDLPEGAVAAAVGAALARVGLAGFERRPTSSLSGGQKQRVAIAGALAESPQVLLLDELTTFLDHEDQLNVLRCVRHIVHGMPSSPGGDHGEHIASHGHKHRHGHRGEGAAARAESGGGSGADDSEAAAASSGARVLDVDVGRDPSNAGGGGGVTAVWVTHRLEELRYADGVSIMEGGRIVFNGTAQQAREYLQRMGANP